MYPQRLIQSFALLGMSLAVGADMVVVPGGAFPMGCSIGDTACEADEGPQGGTAVQVPEFRMDVYEVTVQEYQACMEAGICSRPKDHARNQYCNLGARDRGSHPINCVDWAQAQAYCGWNDKRLPTEPEWEKAARAGSLSRYPWGQEVSCGQAILDDGKTLGSAGAEPDGCGEDRTWPVGSRAPNGLGLYDLHGNAGEWTASWYARNAIAEYYAVGNLAGPAVGRQRVVRGGSWDETPLNLRSSFRNVKLPDSGKRVYGSIGFRCVSD